jgi:hypothetical protein
MSAAAEGAGRLRQVIEAAAPIAKGRPRLSSLTVLQEESDPYRFDRPAAHVAGQWFAAQIARFARGQRVHLRGLHYRLVVAGDVCKPSKKGGGKRGDIYRNTDPDWEWLQWEASAAARWLGYVPFDSIRDERNTPPLIFVPHDREAVASHYPGNACEVPPIDVAMPTFEPSAFVVRQPYRVALIGEKSSLAPVLRPIARRIGAELLLPNGETTTTMIADLAVRANDDGRPLVVLYFSDFDPSGWQMPVSAARKLQALRDLEYPTLEVELHVVSLTREQCEQYDLPSTPLKATESRADKWREVMGREQTEIDALAALRPEILREIAEAAVSPFFDHSLAARCEDAEDEWRVKAAARLEAHPLYAECRAEVETALAAVTVAVAALKVAQDRAMEVLSEVEPPDIELPDPVIDEDPPDPLFTTDDDFATATRKLIARKALDGEGEVPS